MIKNKKECLKRVIFLLLFDVGVLVFYYFLQKYRYATLAIAFAMDIVLLIAMVLFNVYLSITTVLIAKGYSDKELELLYKKWYMKVIEGILTLLAVMEFILVLMR